MNQAFTTALTASQILAAYDQARTIEPHASFDDFAQAIRLQAQVQALREARGEKHRGYKIGFTNRSIWSKYNVARPVWAPMYDTTVHQLAGAAAHLSLARFVLPRIEPEVVIGMASTPKDLSIEALAQSIAWVAPGFEIVQSHYPLWQFTAAQTHACQGLHGALIIGPRIQFDRSLGAQALALLKVNLDCNGKNVAHGQGTAVLDGPLNALQFLARGLQEMQQPLREGQIITTGTLTDAQELQAGQTWSAHWQAPASGHVLDFQSLSLSLTA